MMIRMFPIEYIEGYTRGMGIGIIVCLVLLGVAGAIYWLRKKLIEDN